MVPVLETARLRLRPVAEADIDTIVRLAGDADVALMTARVPHPYGPEHARQWLDFIAARDRERTGATFALASAEEDAFLGGVGLVWKPGRRVASLGYWLGKPYWNRGYMTEAVIKVLEYGFTALGLDAVEATALPHNAASIAVQRKAGMRPLGQRRHADDGRHGDHVVEVHRIERADWQRGDRS